MEIWSRLSIATAVVCGAGAVQANSLLVNNPRLPVPQFQREVRGSWVTTVYRLDWPDTVGNSSSVVSSQRTQMNTILDRLQQARFNTVFLQVRSEGDAMFASTLEPWSRWLTGRQGLAPSVANYDPLQEWITAARARGMWLFAWFNPYRLHVDTPQFSPPPGTGWVDTPSTVASTSYISPLNIYRKRPDLVKRFSVADPTPYWMDPGLPDTPTYVRSIILDVVNRYDIDGVIFDDYFYPNQTFEDAATFAAHPNGFTNLLDWRRDNVDRFIQAVNADIKAAKPQLLFGISPAGIWRPGNPPGTTGNDNFNVIAADSKKWINLGWVDILSPQLYWTIASSGQPYVPLATWWRDQNWQNRHVWISNGAYRMAAADGDWPSSELINQVNQTRLIPGLSGNVFYRNDFIRDDTKGLRTSLASGPYAAPALVPRSPWLDTGAPTLPALSVTTGTTSHVLTWAPGTESEPVRWWAVSMLIGSNWTQQILPGTTLTLTQPIKTAGGSLRAFAVEPVDRLGNMGPRASRIFDLSALGNPNRAR